MRRGLTMALLVALLLTGLARPASAAITFPVTGRLLYYTGAPASGIGVVPFAGGVEISGAGTASASDGTFTLNLPSGIYEIHYAVSDVGLQPISPTSVGVGSAPVAVGDVVVDSSPSIAVRVTDAISGDGLYCSIQIAGADVAWSGRGECDSRGTSAVNVPAGTFDLTITSPAHAPEKRIVSVLRNSQSVVSVAMQRAFTARITGKITDSLTHAPVAGATVKALVTGGSEQTTSDATGSYSVPVDPGVRTVQVTGPTGYVNRNNNITVTAPTTTYDLALDPRATLQGHVYDSAGAPLAGVFVSISADNEGTATTTTASDGSYRLTNVDGASVFLIDFYSAGRNRVQVRRDLPPGQTTTLDASMGSQAIITARLVTEEGWATSGSVWLSGATLASYSTDPVGNLRIAVPAGHYTMTPVSGAWRPPTVVDITLAEGDVRNLGDLVVLKQFSGLFHPVVPQRVLDTRTGLGYSGPVPAGGTVALRPTDSGGYPLFGLASAVVLNVTVTETGAPGFITVYPGGTTMPNASSVNFDAGQTVPNLVTAKVSRDGTVNLTNNSSRPVSLIADYSGYYAFGTPASAGGFGALPPARILDTRTGNGYSGPLPANGTIALQVVGRGGVPATNVAAVVMNTTVTNPTAAGFITAYPSGRAKPNASNVNFGPGQTVPNLVTVRLGADGKVLLTNSSSGSTDLVVDVAGYYLAGTASLEGAFVPVEPQRILDSRYGVGATGPVQADGTAGLQVTGRAGVPASGVSAVVLNTTVTEGRASGFVTVFPSGGATPTASNLNFGPAQTVPNLVIAKLGADGRLNLTNASAGTSQLVGDLAGYFIGP